MQKRYAQMEFCCYLNREIARRFSQMQSFFTKPDGLFVSAANPVM